MKLAALFSGGKDSVYAVFDSIEKGHDVKCLVTLLPKNPESYMFHFPNAEYTRMQSEAMNIPILVKNTPGEKEKELKDLEDVIKEAKEKFNIEGILVGALASEYQKQRVEKIAKKLDLKLVAPQWKIDPEKYWDMILKNNFKVMIIGVACEGLDKEWLGRVIDNQALEELKEISKKYQFHLAFEGGEAETFVLDCPLFKKQIKIEEAKTDWEVDSGIYLFEKVRLIDK